MPHFTPCDRSDGRAIVEAKYQELLRNKKTDRESPFSRQLFHKFFQETFGNDWRKSLPHAHHWICQIRLQDTDHLIQQLNVVSREAFSPIEDLSNVFTDMGGYNGLVNLYCTGVNIPGEEIAYEQAGCSTAGNHGFLQPMVLGNRSHQHVLSLQFREHNTSFTESFIRPWTLLAGYTGAIDLRPTGIPLRRGGIATDGTDGIPSIKAESIDIIRLACNVKDQTNDEIWVRDIYRFNDCLPINIGGEILTYDPGQAVIKETSFIYQKMSYEYSGETLAI